MKWRLDEDHYDNDAMVSLPAGTEVGDGCANEWRYPASSANKALAGKPRPPSRNMTPLDAEAKKVWNEAFGEGERPERDPTKAIPITPVEAKRDTAGNIQPSAPPHQPPAVRVPPTGENVTKDDSVAKERVAGPGKA